MNTETQRAERSEESEFLGGGSGQREPTSGFFRPRKILTPCDSAGLRASVFILVCALAGCSIPQQSLRTLTIPPSGAQVHPSDKSFLMYPFEDQRGEEAGK